MLDGRIKLMIMIEMLKAYDYYGDFKRDLYFTNEYNILPSNLELNLSLKESKENLEKVLSLIDLKNLELVFKNWNTSDYRDSEIQKDYAFEYLFKSNIKKMTIWISLDANDLTIDFMYDASDKECEKWILESNHKLRADLGDIKTPSFKILSMNGGCFHAEEVNTKNFEHLDIELMYNDDFQEINTIITDAIKKVKSGLILLHGKPGTGKTTYIKNLISTNKDKSFIFIQNDFVAELLKPGFISFLLKNKNCTLIIEDAEKVVISRDSQDASVVSTILQLTDGLFSDYLNIKVICSFNTDLNKIDKALLRKGRMIARYEFDDLSIEKANQLLIKNGQKELNKKMSIAEIYGLKEKSFSNLAYNKIGFNKASYSKV